MENVPSAATVPAPNTIPVCAVARGKSKASDASRAVLTRRFHESPTSIGQGGLPGRMLHIVVGRPPERGVEFAP